MRQALKITKTLTDLRINLDNISEWNLYLLHVAEGIAENDSLKYLFIKNESCSNDAFFASLSKVSGLKKFNYETTMRRTSSYKEKEILFGQCDCLTTIKIICHTKFVDSDLFDKLWKNLISNMSIVDIDLDLFMDQSGYTFIEKIL